MLEIGFEQKPVENRLKRIILSYYSQFLVCVSSVTQIKWKTRVRGEAKCPFTSTNVTNADVSLKSWFFHLIVGRGFAVLPAVMGIRAGSCLPFHVGHPQAPEI